MRQDTEEQALAYASQALQWLLLESQQWRSVCLNLLGSRAVSCGQLTFLASYGISDLCLSCVRTPGKECAARISA